MEYDVVVVGAGPSGLAAAIRLKQLAAAAGSELGVCVVEKGSEVGAHILSGAVFEPRALNELIPDWRERGAPLDTPATDDRFLLPDREPRACGCRRRRRCTITATTSSASAICAAGWRRRPRSSGSRSIPALPPPRCCTTTTAGCCGVATGDMGIGKDGQPTAAITRGVELRARETLFAEGCRGSLTKTLVERFRPARRPRPADLCDRHQGIVGGRAGAAPAGPGRPHDRLAARQRAPMAARSSITSKTARWRSGLSSGSTTRTRI